MPKPYSEMQQRATGIAVAIGLLVVVFGFAAILSFEVSHVSKSNPVWFVGMLIIFGAALALIALVFRWLGLANPAEAFGLPTGSIRALLAVAVMLLFAVFGLSSIVGDDNLPKSPAERLLSSAVVATDKAPAEIQRYAALNIAAIQESADANVTKLLLYRMEKSRPTETVDLMKQIITALVTLVTSVVSFYFGSRSVEAAKDGRDGAGTPKLPASTAEDLKLVDAGLEDATKRLAALKSEKAATGSEAALATKLAQLEEALKTAKANRAKLEASTKDLAAGSATAEGVTSEAALLKAALQAIKDLLTQAEALVAKG